METSSVGEQRLRGLLSAAKVKRLLLRPEPHHEQRVSVNTLA
jgi:hypothetical protein